MYDLWWCLMTSLMGFCLIFLTGVILFPPQSHAGKVVERHWYEKNKHIFPASRWEVLILSVSYAHSA